MSLHPIYNVTAESLLGYIDPTNEEQGPIPESRRSLNLKSQLGILQTKPQAFQAKIYAEVAAKYLPTLVELFRKRTEVLGSVVTLINVVTSTPYFIRFLRTPAGAGLAALQVKRTAAAAADQMGYMSADDIGELCQFLSTMLLLQGTEDIEEADKAVLVQHLEVWYNAYKGRLASDTASRCLALFESGSGDAILRSRLGDVRLMLESKLDQCGGPGCVRRANKNTELLHCSRCKSACYCGVAHQKAAWASHKPLCIAPSF